VCVELHPIPCFITDDKEYDIEQLFVSVGNDALPDTLTKCKDTVLPARPQYGVMDPYRAMYFGWSTLPQRFPDSFKVEFDLIVKDKRGAAETSHTRFSNVAIRYQY
jgi:hypothetical protein